MERAPNAFARHSACHGCKAPGWALVRGLCPATVETSVAGGRWLNAATASLRVAVLGAVAAERLGIDRISLGERIWLGGQWFYVAGFLTRARARAGDRHLRARRLQSRRALPRLRRAPDHRLRSRRHESGYGRSIRPLRDRQPLSTQRGQRQPAVRRPQRPRRSPGRHPQRTLPRPRRRLPARRRRRGRQRHAHRRARTPSEIGLRRALGATKGNIHHSGPRRVDPACAGWRRLLAARPPRRRMSPTGALRTV